MAISKASVSSAQEMEFVITSYLTEGFIVSDHTPTTVTLQKRKEFNLFWVIADFSLCILPLVLPRPFDKSIDDVEIVEISVTSPAR